MVSETAVLTFSSDDLLALHRSSYSKELPLGALGFESADDFFGSMNEFLPISTPNGTRFLFTGKKPSRKRSHEETDQALSVERQDLSPPPKEPKKEEPDDELDAGQPTSSNYQPAVANSHIVLPAPRRTPAPTPPRHLNSHPDPATLSFKDLYMLRKVEMVLDLIDSCGGLHLAHGLARATDVYDKYTQFFHTTVFIPSWEWLIEGSKRCPNKIEKMCDDPLIVRNPFIGIRNTPVVFEYRKSLDREDEKRLMEARARISQFLSDKWTISMPQLDMAYFEAYGVALDEKERERLVGIGAVDMFCYRLAGTSFESSKIVYKGSTRRDIHMMLVSSAAERTLCRLPEPLTWPKTHHTDMGGIAIDRGGEGLAVVPLPDVTQIPLKELGAIIVVSKCFDVLNFLKVEELPMTAMKKILEDAYGHCSPVLYQQMNIYHKNTEKYPIFSTGFRRLNKPSQTIFVELQPGRTQEEVAVFVAEVQVEFDRRMEGLRRRIREILPVDGDSLSFPEVFERYRDQFEGPDFYLPDFFKFAECGCKIFFCSALQGYERFTAKIIFKGVKQESLRIRRATDSDAYPSEIRYFLPRMKPTDELSFIQMDKMMAIERLLTLLIGIGGKASKEELEEMHKSVYGREISDESWTTYKRCPTKTTTSGGRSFFQLPYYGRKFDPFTNYMRAVRLQFDNKMKEAREWILGRLEVQNPLSLEEVVDTYSKLFHKRHNKKPNPHSFPQLFSLASTKTADDFLRRVEGDNVFTAKILYYKNNNGVVFLARSTPELIEAITGSPGGDEAIQPPGDGERAAENGTHATPPNLMQPLAASGVLHVNPDEALEENEEEEISSDGSDISSDDDEDSDSEEDEEDSDDSDDSPDAIEYDDEIFDEEMEAEARDLLAEANGDDSGDDVTGEVQIDVGLDTTSAAEPKEAIYREALEGTNGEEQMDDVIRSQGEKEEDSFERDTVEEEEDAATDITAPVDDDEEEDGASERGLENETLRGSENAEEDEDSIIETCRGISEDGEVWYDFDEYVAQLRNENSGYLEECRDKEEFEKEEDSRSEGSEDGTDEADDDDVAEFRGLDDERKEILDEYLASLSDEESEEEEEISSGVSDSSSDDDEDSDSEEDEDDEDSDDPESSPDSIEYDDDIFDEEMEAEARDLLSEANGDDSGDDVTDELQIDVGLDTKDATEAIDSKVVKDKNGEKEVNDVIRAQDRKEEGRSALVTVEEDTSNGGCEDEADADDVMKHLEEGKKLDGVVPAKSGGSEARIERDTSGIAAARSLISFTPMNSPASDSPPAALPHGSNANDEEFDHVGELVKSGLKQAAALGKDTKKIIGSLLGVLYEK